MIINKIIDVGIDGMVKITPDQGPAFYLRKKYLKNIDFNSLYPGLEITDSDLQGELFDGGLAAAVEFKALSYLARCEQSYFNLTLKLQKKGYKKVYIDMALSYLEGKNYLSDSRFSRAWLNSRGINHYEGRGKLLSLLLSKGISKDISEAAVQEYFQDKDEYEIARKALEKFQKKGKEGDKLVQAMLQAGFSFKIIKSILSE